MCTNQILLKGSHVSKVVDECPDTKMVLMNGQVKSHLLVLATNPFLHQLIKSSWVPGEISTILMPQHSVKDLLLEFPLPVVTIFTNVVNETGEAEISRTIGSNTKTSSVSGEMKVEEEENDEVEETQEEEVGEIVGDKNLYSKFEPILKQNLSTGFQEQVETLRKRLPAETFPSRSPSSGKRRKKGEDFKDQSELSEQNIPKDELISDLLEDSEKTVNKDITVAEIGDPAWIPGLVESESELNSSIKESDFGEKFGKNLSIFSSDRNIVFPIKKGKKGMIFTKDDEHDWHLYKLNNSKPKAKSDYYHCHRCPIVLQTFDNFF